jgi:hypothetical protein
VSSSPGGSLPQNGGEKRYRRKDVVVPPEHGPDLVHGNQVEYVPVDQESPGRHLLASREKTRVKGLPRVDPLGNYQRVPLLTPE